MGARAQDINAFKHEMAAQFKMRDLGPLSYYLSIEIKAREGCHPAGPTCICGEAARAWRHGGLQAVCDSNGGKLKLSKQSTATKVDVTCYRSIIGGLRWLAHTRPDIMFVVGYMSRFLEDAREDHWVTVKQLLRYIKGSLDQAVIFAKSIRLQLTVFSEAPPKSSESEQGLIAFNDADMVGDVDGQKSTFVVLIFLGSALIAWQSLKLKMVALSTCKVEYVAAATAACQGVWLCRLLGELTGKEISPPMLLVDNKPVIALAKNLVLHDQSKHIDIKFHFLEDCVDGGQVVIEFIETGRQLADILTKSLGRLRFLELRKMIGMSRIRGRIVSCNLLLPSLSLSLSLSLCCSKDFWVSMCCPSLVL